MRTEELLVEVAYTALTIATNCASALAEKDLLTDGNSELIEGQLRRLAQLLENLHDDGADALPSAQSARLNSAARQIERFRKTRPTSDGG